MSFLTLYKEAFKYLAIMFVKNKFCNHLKKGP
jgi:hypothetical protein